MLEIIICEDDENQRNIMETIIKEEIEKGSLSTKVAFSTGNWKELISFLEKSEKSNFIYFLDVEIGKDINGIELGKKIREYDSIGYIIFVTSHYEMSLLTYKYKVRAMDYIIKDKAEVMSASIGSCIKEALKDYDNMHTREKDDFQITQGSRIINISMENILFFETTMSNHKLRIHTIEGQIEFYGKMKDIEKKVPSSFYKIHRSFYINTKKIKEINKEKLIVKMINGEECYISRLSLKGFLEYIG